MVKVDALSSDRTATTTLVLASASKTRAAVLQAAGVEFIVRPSSVNEAAIKLSMRTETAAPEAVVKALANAKAHEVSLQLPEMLVIGSDQVLVCDGTLFDKPSDLRVARAQLERLRGREHTLITAVSVVRNGLEIWSTLACSRLTLRAFSDEFLDRYLEVVREGVTKSVGGYQLEGVGAQLLERVEGDWFAILGLPLIPLLEFLRDQDVLAT